MADLPSLPFAPVGIATRVIGAHRNVASVREASRKSPRRLAAGQARGGLPCGGLGLLRDAAAAQRRRTESLPISTEGARIAFIAAAKEAGILVRDEARSGQRDA